MSKRPNPIQNLAISDTGFVFDPTSGATFTLNASGLVILNALREGLSLDETIARVCERFEDVAGDTKDEVLDFVQRLRQHGLLPGDFVLSARDAGGAR